MSEDFGGLMRGGESVDPSQVPTEALVDEPVPFVVFPDGKKRRAAIILHVADFLIPGAAVPVKAVTLVPEPEPTLEGQIRVARTLESPFLESVRARGIGPVGSWALLPLAGDWRDAIAKALIPRVEESIAENPNLHPVLIALVDTGMLGLTPLATGELRRLRRLHVGASIHLTSLRARV